MQPTAPPARTRYLATLFSGLVDFILGTVLLFSWLDLLPFTLDFIGIPRWVFGLLGAILAVSGVVVFTYSLVKIKESE